MTTQVKCDCGCGLEVGSEDFINKHVPKCERCGIPICFCECNPMEYTE